MDEKYLNVLNMLKKYNQEHLLRFYNDLNNEEKEQLLNELLCIDYTEIEELSNKVKKDITNTSKNKDEITPISVADEARMTSIEIEKYNRTGIDIIKSGKYAVVTMAGGQGTRLGHNGPKGTYVMNLNKDMSLFEILCEKLKEINKKYDIIIPWYIMTSVENNDETIKFFEDNNYFEYPKNSVRFFTQGELPIVNKDGKILMESKNKVKQAANGNGGIFESMYANGIIKSMQDKEIEWIFIGAIDNPLVPMADTILLRIF